MLDAALSVYAYKRMLVSYVFTPLFEHRCQCKAWYSALIKIDFPTPTPLNRKAYICSVLYLFHCMTWLKSSLCLMCRLDTSSRYSSLGNLSELYSVSCLVNGIPTSPPMSYSLFQLAFQDQSQQTFLIPDFLSVL